MFSSGEGGGYVAEKAETASGWLFPVGDEVAELGYVDMFTDMFDSIDEGRAPTRDASTTATSSTRSWTRATAPPPHGAGSRCSSTTGAAARPSGSPRQRREHEGRTVIKEEQMPDGRRKLILKDESTGVFSDVVV